MAIGILSKNDINEVVQKDLSPDAPDYENNIRSKFPGFNLIISFPTRPKNDPDSVLTFPAFIKSVKDSFNPTYGSKPVYGRMDPIPIYQGTTRTISFDLALPSNGLAHSKVIARKLNILVRNLYPSYQKSGNVNIISSPPLARILFSNIIRQGVAGLSSPLLGYFSSNIIIEHDLTNGVFSRDEGFETYAKAYNLSFSFNVLHEFTPGFINNGSSAVTNELNILLGG